MDREMLGLSINIPTTVPEDVDLVEYYVRVWNELNESVTGQNSDRLFLACLYSETIVWKALTYFNPPQLSNFTLKLKALGYEVQSAEVHHQRACGFGKRLSSVLSEFDLIGVELDVVPNHLISRAQDQSWDADTIGKHIEPRLQLYRQARAVKAYREKISENAKLVAARLEVLFKETGKRPITLNEAEQTRKLINSQNLIDSISGQSESLSQAENQYSANPDEVIQIQKVLSAAIASDSLIAYQSQNLIGPILDQSEFPSQAKNQSIDYPDETIHIQKLLNDEIAKNSLIAHQSQNPIYPIPGQLEYPLQAENKYIVNPNKVIQNQKLLDTTLASNSLTNHRSKNRTDPISDQSESPPQAKNQPIVNPDDIFRLHETFTEVVTAIEKAIECILEPSPPEMAISTGLALPLPVLPQSWSAEKDFKAVGTISKATQRSIEPVGPHFLAHARRARHKRTFSEDDRIQAQESVKKVEDDDSGEISEPEDPAMLLRDAKDWKGQDHYAVLGLSKYRWKATEEQIKRAHRKKVLRHHPDKKAAAGSAEDDSFFKCIQKATEILLDPIKRRQFDSVDEAADVEPPTKKQVQKGNFYKLWGPVFKAEGRFSRIQAVPKLGDENSTKEEVENFYNFWYNFDSWRSFEYQDEDVPDDNENRDQKRHMERKNNNARKKKKTEDSARLRKLLDDCSGMDERIKKFRQEANASKNKKRLEKEAAEKKAAEESKAKKEAEEKAAKEAEETAKAEREQGKKAKEAAKNAVKKNKRVLKSSVKDANYFVQGDPPVATIDAVLNDVELVQSKVDPDEIAALAAKLIGLKVADEIKAVWVAEIERLVEAGKLREGDVKRLVL